VLAAAGYTLVNRPELADVVVLNTCMVRERAEQKVIGRVGELSGRKRGGRPLIGVGGCMAQGRAEAMADLCPGADFIFGTGNLDEIPALVARARTGTQILSVPQPGRNGTALPLVRSSKVQASVAISEGCNHACAYCIVPFVRGPLRSRRLADILAELRALVEGGYLEATLLGQNVDAYGQDLNDGTDFAALLREVSQLPLARVRFTSSHPAYISDQVLSAMAGGANICEHLHLAVQSGSDRVLAAMRRGYTRDSFVQLAERARAAVPGLNLTTDVIVGFPGETEEDFEATLSLIRELKFGSVFVAAYSPRPHTCAAALHDSVPPEEKRRRLSEVLALSRSIAEALHQSRLGAVVEVLVDGVLPERQLLHGKTRDHRTVLFQGDAAMIGTMLHVHITKATSGAMHGTLVKEPRAPDRHAGPGAGQDLLGGAPGAPSGR